jgi:hypothetical protein
MAANAIAWDQKRADRIKTIWQKLDGTYDPQEASKPQAITKEHLKAIFGC